MIHRNRMCKIENHAARFQNNTRAIFNNILLQYRATTAFLI